MLTSNLATNPGRKNQFRHFKGGRKKFARLDKFFVFLKIVGGIKKWNSDVVCAFQATILSLKFHVFGVFFFRSIFIIEKK